MSKPAQPAQFHPLTGERLDEGDALLVAEPVDAPPVLDVPPVVADTDAVIPTPSGKKK